MEDRIYANLDMDDEWVELISNARNLGITIDEIRYYLKQMADNNLFFIIDDFYKKQTRAIP
jgi:DNA-binding transcriptional MerR regulator